MPLPSSSFIISPNSQPAVIPTPNGRHLEFTPNAMPETPFAKTLSYFKQKGKENSPCKNRRNALLPEEIAELAWEANDEEDLEKYRDMDLAPMEPVMESDAAGDLITFGTLVKSDITTVSNAPSIVMQRNESTGTYDFLVQDIDVSRTFKAAETRPQPPATPSIRHSHPIEQNEEDIADAETLDAAPNAVQRQLIICPLDPTFVTVIGMLPRAMFWVAAAPVAKFSNKAYDTVVEKFTQMEL